MTANIKLSRGFALACGFLLMLCSGLVFSWSILAGPIEVELGFTRQQTSLVFPFSLSISIFGQMLAGYLQKKIGLKYNFFIAAGLYLIGFWTASKSHTIGQIYLGYGVLVGLAIGMLFNAVLINVPAFSLPKNESFGTGVVLMGFGLGSMVLGTLAAQLIQISGWRVVFTGFAIGYAALSLLGSLLIPSSIHLKSETRQEKKTRDLSPPQLMKLRSYRTFFLWSVVLVWGALVVSGHAALCAAEMTSDPMVASTAVTANAMANIFSRIAFGYSYQRFGERRCRWSLTTLACIGALVCAVSYVGKTLVGLLMGFSVLGAVNGGNSVVGTAYIREKFGRTYFGSNTAMTNLHLAISSFIGPAVAGVIRTQSGSYTSVFLLMVLVSAAAAILLCISIAYEKKELTDLKGKEIQQIGC